MGFASWVNVKITDNGNLNFAGRQAILLSIKVYFQTLAILNRNLLTRNQSFECLPKIKNPEESVCLKKMELARKRHSLADHVL